MAGKRKVPAKTTEKKKTEPTLDWKDGYWWWVDGNKRENLGRNKRYAEQLLAERT